MVKPFMFVCVWQGWGGAVGGWGLVGDPNAHSQWLFRPFLRSPDALTRTVLKALHEEVVSLKAFIQMQTYPPGVGKRGKSGKI